jgi:hypothetical protein
MMVYLLLLHFKQSLIQEHNPEQEGDLKHLEKTNNPKKPNIKQRESPLTRTPARGLVTLLGERLKACWKMSIHWIKCLQNLLFEIITPNIRLIIITMK